MAKMQENKNQQTMQNIQMMRSEQRKDDPRINTLTQSGTTTREDKAEDKNPEADTCVRKARENNTGFDLQEEKANFLEAKKSFVDIGDLTSNMQMQLVPKKNAPEVGTAMENPNSTVLKSFLQTCMKLLRDQKAVEGLQKLIDNCASKENPQHEKFIVNKVNKNKKRNGREMQLTAQNGDFEMDQLIMDFGSDANFL